MNVRELHMQNFRRHRDTRIEMPAGVTAVLGRNGAGKSTLLEAIGFALFGVTAARTGKDLLRHSDAAPSDTVRVHLAMELGDQAIEITRELRGKNLTPSATVTVDGAVLVAPGAGSNDAATKAIERRLGMPADAFFSTVVARQKELSRLADATPAERKRQILQMLGVDQIERAIQRARGRRRELSTRLDEARTGSPDPKALAAAIEQAETSAQAASKDIEATEAAWNKTQAALQHATKAHAAVQAAQEAHRQAKTEHDRCERDLQRIESIRQETRARLDTAAQAAKEADGLRPLASERADREAAFEAARTAHQHGEAWEKEQARCQRVRKEAEAAHKAIPAAPDALPDPAPWERRSDDAEKEVAATRTRAAQADAEVQHLRQRHRRLSQLGADAPCPTCERPLGDHVAATLEEVAAAYEHAQAEAKAAQAARQASENEAAAAKREMQAYEATRREHERRTQVRAHAEAAALRLQAEADRLAQELGPRPDVVELAPLRAAYDEARHAHERCIALDAKAAEAKELKARLAKAEADHAAAKIALEAATRRVTEQTDQTEALARSQADLESARSQERDADWACQEARHRLALAEQALQQARQAYEDHKAKQQRIQSLEQDLRYWTALAGPRGGGLLDGFKDHVMQRVTPTISAEASRLLSLFTGGRYDEVLLDDDYQVFVSDGGIWYSLDRFSGGENDLVHLALRLAVSRMLAERAGGAELRFLALDEVFGSLDADRRDLVVAALQGLGSLYSQVLLVTHLEPMRDALDQALVVEAVGDDARVRLYSG